MRDVTAEWLKELKNISAGIQKIYCRNTWRQRNGSMGPIVVSNTACPKALTDISGRTLPEAMQVWREADA